MASLFLITLPPITKTALLYGLNHLGADKSKIDDVDINLFTGRFSITGLQVQTGKQEALQIGQISTTFNYWKLLKNHILIDNISLKNSHFPLIKKDNKAFYIGVNLNKNNLKNSALKDNLGARKESTEWLLTINKLLIENSTFQIETPSISSNIHIETATLTQFFSQPSEQSQLFAKATIDNTHVKIGNHDFQITTEKPIEWRSKQRVQLSQKTSPSVFIKGNMEVGELSIYSPTKKIAYTHNNSSLLLSIDANPDSTDGSFTRTSIKSELSIRKPRLSGQLIDEPTAEILKGSASRLELQLIQRLTLNEHFLPLHSSGTGRFNLQEAKLKLNTKGFEYSHDDLAMQWSLKAIDLDKRDWGNKFEVDSSITLKQAQILDLHQKLNLLQLPQLTIQKIKLTGADQLQVGSIQLNQARGLSPLSETLEPFIFSESLNIKDLTLHPLNNLYIEQIKASDLNALIYITKDKQLKFLSSSLSRLQSLNLGTPVVDKKKTTENPDKTAIEMPKEDALPPLSTPSFTWKINNILLNNSALTLVDESVSPSFNSTLTLNELTLRPFSNAQDEASSHISLKGRLNSHSKLEAQGTFTPFSSKLSSNINLSIKALELPPFSPYLKQSAGYRIKHGQLNAAIQINVKDNKLDSTVMLNLNKLKLVPASEDAIKRLNKQLTMPLDVALNTLRDKNDNLQVSIPVRGNLSDPDFDFSDILKQASAKATRKASMSLLKHALQPYGTMITVAELAYKGGKKLTAIRLNPINYPIASTELSDEQKDYLGKIALLLEERPGLGITLCGVASIGELPTSQTEEDSLRFAQVRAEKVKSHLINEHEIDAARLFSCLPKIDKAKKKKNVGRVELHI
ncbi:MAG: DUF748 domain-containing protein [Pseudomonadales bacterium]|nr:DUF748 domain-containing protein [Pseudomonadales bacterium]